MSLFVAVTTWEVTRKDYYWYNVSLEVYASEPEHVLRIIFTLIS